MQSIFGHTYDKNASQHTQFMQCIGKDMGIGRPASISKSKLVSSFSFGWLKLNFFHISEWFSTFSFVFFLYIFSLLHVFFAAIFHVAKTIYMKEFENILASDMFWLRLCNSSHCADIMSVEHANSLKTLQRIFNAFPPHCFSSTSCVAYASHASLTDALWGNMCCLYLVLQNEGFLIFRAWSFFFNSFEVIE